MSGQGLRIRNADGSVQFDSTTSVLRTLTSVVTGANDGSVNVPGLAAGTPVIGVVANSMEVGQAPTTSVSGTTVSWSYGGAAKRVGATVNILVM